MSKTTPLAERFWRHVAPEPNCGCWLWTALIGREGYGRFNVDAHTPRLAHRVSYEMEKGPIPHGLELDHLCRVRSCVNPAHLEPVTRKENMRRSPLVGRWERPIMCVRGHAKTGDNLYINSRGHRCCRICTKKSQSRRKSS